MARRQAFKIAVVDDDRRILRSLKSLLESVGHIPLLFASAEAFLAANGAFDVDCLISDIGLPGMSGIALREAVGDSRPSLPVILVTGRAELLPKAESSRSTGQLFLKPLDGLLLLRTLDGVLKSTDPV
jgi:FixJ family two-component response regulator